MPDLPPIEVETARNPDVSVIWLHGLGADGGDFEPIVPELGLGPTPGVRFIFPHAPYLPVTCNGGYVMRAWYDIISLDSESREVDVAGLLQSRAAVRRLIAREAERGVPSQRIFLAGFSQGGAVAYLTGLTHPDPLAGIIALSTYIPSPDLVTADATGANRRIPIFAAHGNEDPVVSPALGERARDLLLALGYPLTWHTYPMPHAVCGEEVRDLGAWLATRFQRLAA